MNLNWWVFYHNVNSQQMELFNIFSHGSFKKDVEDSMKKCDSREEFSEQVKKHLMYYFWCKSEYEIIIGPWCGGRNTKETKVDIYSQVMMNWEHFIDYLWEFKYGIWTIH